MAVFENEDTAKRRGEMNALVQRLALSDRRIHAVNIEPLFVLPTGEVLFVDEAGRGGCGMIALTCPGLVRDWLLG